MRKSNTITLGSWFEPNGRNKAVQPPSYDELIYVDGVRTSDIGLILHQKELGELSDPELIEIMQKMAKPDVKGSAFSGWSDDQLLTLCKSRRCNTFHDMKEYMDWLSSSSEQAKFTRESFVADLKAQEQYDELRKQNDGSDNKKG